VINAHGANPVDNVRYCDEIAVPAPGLAEHKQQLVPIFASGSATFFAEASPLDPPLNGCVAPTADPSAPTYLCKRPLAGTRVIEHTMEGHEPVIYGISPDVGGLECTGRYWEFGPVLDRNPREGWLCLAARASDLVGNVRVSAPLIVCYDDDNTPEVPDCIDPNDPTHTRVLDPATVDPPITCTDGCTPVRFPYRIIDDLR
jgi:hypothetical protein